MLVVVSYDVPENRRRGRIAQALQDFGGERVQLSVFECYLTPRNWTRLQERLGKIINPDEDSVRLYRLCVRKERIPVRGLKRYADLGIKTETTSNRGQKRTNPREGIETSCMCTAHTGMRQKRTNPREGIETACLRPFRSPSPPRSEKNESP